MDRGAKVWAVVEFVTTSRLRAVVAPADWLRIENGPRRTPAEVWDRWPNAVGLLDGPMFGNRRIAGVDRTAALFALRDAPGGVDVPSQEPAQGVTLSVLGDGTAVASRGGVIPSSAAVGVQGWPSLIVAGEITATNVGTNSERVPRAAWAQLPGNRVALVATTGRSMVDFAQAIRADLRAESAGYTDGGSSTYLGARGAPSGWVGITAPSPRVYAWLVLTSPNAATSGESGGGDVAIAAVVVAMLAWRGGRR